MATATVYLKSQTKNADGTYSTTWSHAPVDPLDVEYDGVSLRQLIEWDVAAGREEFVLDPDSSSRSIAAVVVRAAFSSAQRAAVSAHWSAELRKRTEAAKQKDRNQVTMENDDD